MRLPPILRKIHEKVTTKMSESWFVENILIAHSIRLHSVELSCWVLDKCNPIFIVKTPGSYEIDVVGEYADVVVTAMAFPMQEVNDFDGCYCQPVTEQPIIEQPLL